MREAQNRRARAPTSWLACRRFAYGVEPPAGDFLRDDYRLLARGDLTYMNIIVL